MTVGIRQFHLSTPPMLRRSAQSNSNHVAAWLCGCWVLLAFLGPIAQAGNASERCATTDSVSAIIATSPSYGVSAVDESSLWLSMSSLTEDFVGYHHGVIDATLRLSYFPSAGVSRCLGSCQPTLLDLGSLLRL